MRPFSPSIVFVLCAAGVACGVAFGLWIGGLAEHRSQPGALLLDLPSPERESAITLDSGPTRQMTDLNQRIELASKDPGSPDDTDEQEAEAEQKVELNLREMSGAQIARLTDAELESVTNCSMGDEAIMRYATCEPVNFLSTTSPGNKADFNRVWASAVHGRNVSAVAFAQAKEELLRLRTRIQQIVTEERKSPEFIENVPFNATDAQRKRSMASWCGHTDRIERRARPFMKESETIVLSLFEVIDPSVRLAW